MIVGTVVEEWRHEWEVPGRRGVRSDPTCEMHTGEIHDDTTCGKPATVRVNYWPHWSVFWCPEHAAHFAEPPGRWDLADRPVDPDDREFWLGDLDVPSFLRVAK